MSGDGVCRGADWQGTARPHHAHTTCGNKATIIKNSIVWRSLRPSPNVLGSLLHIDRHTEHSCCTALVNLTNNNALFPVGSAGHELPVIAAGVILVKKLALRAECIDRPMTCRRSEQVPASPGRPQAFHRCFHRCRVQVENSKFSSMAQPAAADHQNSLSIDQTDAGSHPSQQHNNVSRHHSRVPIAPCRRHASRSTAADCDTGLLLGRTPDSSRSESLRTSATGSSCPSTWSSMSLGSSAGSSFDSAHLTSATWPVGPTSMSNESPSSRLTEQDTPPSSLGVWLLGACTVVAVAFESLRCLQVLSTTRHQGALFRLLALDCSWEGRVGLPHPKAFFFAC